MRKRNKKKKHSCGLCKPHKTGGNKFQGHPKDFQSLKLYEKDKNNLEGKI